MPIRSLLHCWFLLVSTGTCVSTWAGEIELATDAPPALTPEESRKLFQVAEGFHVELVASEPHVMDPVAMAFDAQGRIFVCEIHGYNLEGYYDILELNKTGELDKQVRRIPANDDAFRRAQTEQYGTVKLLEDTNGDGRIDRSHILADHLPPCYGVIPARDGVIVFCAPDIVYLADRDGDGRAEIRETLFTGFGVGELWTRINNPRWGPDNWIYGVSGGGSGGTIRGPHMADDVRLGSVCFRFKADGSNLEAAGGGTHGFGQAVDDWGDRYLCTNQQHAMHVLPLANRYLARNPFVAAPVVTRNISSYGHPARVYPTSRPDPWRRARAADPAWVRFYGEAEATANGYFTAASGQTIYQAAQFPAEFHGNHFSVDNAQNMIHRYLLVPDGVSYRARRVREDEQSEFLTSTEQWFRPVNLSTGPDGGLYVVDMYRDIIEDYSAIPRYLQQLYVRSLIAGAKHGRIWRIVADGKEGVPARIDLSKSTSGQLVDHLSHTNRWWRMTSQRLLVERQDRSVVKQLETLVHSSPTPQARMHAMYTLDALDAPSTDTLRHALGDHHFAIRSHALQLADRQLDQHPELLDAMLPLAYDSHSRVRLQAALSLGESDSERAVSALTGLALRHGDDPWVTAAVLSSATDTADQLLEEILSARSETNHGLSMLHALASVVGARRVGGEVANLLSILGRRQIQFEDDEDLNQLPRSTVLALQRQCLSGLVKGLESGRAIPVDSPNIAIGLQPLLASGDREIRALSLRVANLLGLQQIPEMRTMFAAARQDALDEDRPIDQRLHSIALLAAAPLDDLRAVARQLLDTRQPIELQLASVQAVAAAEQPEAATLLLDGFASFTPRMRAAVINAVLARQNRLPILLDAIQRGTVPQSSIDALRREQLINHSDSKIADRARQLLSSSGGKLDRQKVLDRYQQALQLRRDVERGGKVFEKQCAKCHKLGEQGYEVGPDLLTSKTRADETLLSDVLDPSNQITVGYNQYTVITEAGRIFSGVLSAETATSITLRAEEQKEIVVLRKDIDEMVASTVSMMPEDLDKEVTPQDLADLLGFLRQTLGPTRQTKVVLFDDDAAFADLLTEGAGTASVDVTDSHRGDAALLVSPPQRFSASIPGWAYRISEHPEAGEFRYLRFAWKQVAGRGVMLELAADGSWPPPDEARMRYYSGENTTEWKAVCVCEDAPRNWTVVTRDLWKDFGSFTLTGIAPTAMGGNAMFDAVELLQSLEE